MYTKQEIITRSHREVRSQHCISRETSVQLQTAPRRGRKHERRPADAENGNHRINKHGGCFQGVRRVVRK